MSEAWGCLPMHLLLCTTRQRPAAVCERLPLASRRAPRLYEGMAHRQSWRGYAVFGHPNPDDTSSRHHLSRAPTQRFNGHQTRLEPGAGAVEEAHHVEQEGSAQDGDDEAPEVESGDAGATQGADD